MSKTRKQKHSLVRGWSKQQPTRHQRTLMYKRCGKKCFLGPNKSFPICKKHTCKIDKRGLMSAYMRAKEYKSITKSRKYSRIANKAKKLLRRGRGGAVEQSIKNNPSYLPNEEKFGPMIQQQVERQRDLENRQRQLQRQLQSQEDRVVDDTMDLLRAHNR